MTNLKEHVYKLQKLENAAADKAGMRFMLLDEAGLLGKDGSKVIDAFTEQVLQDISGEILAAATLGKKLGNTIQKAVKDAR